MATKIETSNKVFGIGLWKTGSTSLADALNLVGIKTIHYPYDEQTFVQLTKGDYQLTLLEKYDAVVDAVAPFYAELDEAFPESKFILTVREKTSWLRSLEHHWLFMKEWALREPRFQRCTDFMCASHYGVLDFCSSRCGHVYEWHSRNVLWYFKDRGEDLLVIDVCAGDGWDKLCPFLGVPVPDQPFPHTNTRTEKSAARQWMYRLDQATKSLAEVIPRDASLILIDDQQFAHTILTEGRQVFPFLERGGRYWGRPANSEIAIEELERLRGRGACFVVFGWPTFWWLTYYVEFRRYLERQFERILTDENLMVFDLR